MTALALGARLSAARDCLFAGGSDVVRTGLAQELLRTHAQSLTAEQKDWILHDNVAEFYGITL